MTDIRHETMRIGGEHVDTDARIEVRYPYTDEVIGTVPAGTAEHARRAFEIAANYKPKLTRYERSQILQKAGEIIGSNVIADLVQKVVLNGDNVDEAISDASTAIEQIMQG